jgi:hypothetical protein
MGGAAVSFGRWLPIFGETKREAETCFYKTLKPSSELHETADKRAVIKQSSQFV